MQLQGGKPSTATIRFAQSWLPDTAYAYLPALDASGGDIWFGTAYAGTGGRLPQAGRRAITHGNTLLHELGHGTRPEARP